MKKLLVVSAFFAGTCAVSLASEQTATVRYEGQRDPFGVPAVRNIIKPDVKNEISNISFALEGLLWETERPQAIINGKIVEKGDNVQGAEVLAIDKKGVRMRYKGQEFILRPRGKMQ